MVILLGLVLVFIGVCVFSVGETAPQGGEPLSDVEQRKLCRAVKAAGNDHAAVAAAFSRAAASRK